MEELMDALATHRNLKPISLKNYKTTLNKLAREVQGESFNGIQFLKQRENAILNFLSKLSLSSKKQYLSAILVALSPVKKNAPTQGYEEIYKKYLNMLKQQNQTYKNNIKNNTMSAHDEKNWTTMEELKKIVKQLLKEIKLKNKLSADPEKVNNKTFQLIQKYLIGELYTSIPPARLDYADMKKINKNDFSKLSNEEKQKNKYLVNQSARKKYIYYGSNSRKIKTPDPVIIQIPTRLNSLLNYWFRINTTNNLLVNYRREKLNKNQLSKLLTEIFKSTNKNISANIIRKIYLSETNGDALAEMKKNATAMNHSVSMANETYVKELEED